MLPTISPFATQEPAPLEALHPGQPNYGVIYVDLMILEKTEKAIKVIRKGSTKNPIWLPLSSSSASSYGEFSRPEFKKPVAIAIKTWLYKKVFTEL